MMRMWAMIALVAILAFGATADVAVAGDYPEVAYYVGRTGYATVSEMELETGSDARRAYGVLADSSMWEGEMDGFRVIDEGDMLDDLVEDMDADAGYLITGTTSGTDTVLLIARTGTTIWFGVYLGSVPADDGIAYFTDVVAERSLNADAPRGWRLDTEV